MVDRSSKGGQTRRRYLKTIGGVAAVGTLAGCTGSDGDEDGSVTVNVATAPSGSSSFVAGQGLSRALGNHSDSVQMTVAETDGWVANANLYDDGEFDTIMIDSNTLDQAKNGEDPFEQPLDLPLQGFQYTSLEIYFVAVEGSGIESTDDLTSEHTVWPLQPGFGTRLITEELMRESGLWDRVQISNVSTGDAAGATEEGRIDVLAVYGANGVGLSGWAEEVGTRNDIYAIELGDDFEEVVDESLGARKTQFEPYGFEQDLTSVTDEATSWALDGQYMFSTEISTETAYELARVSHEHVDVIRESDEAYPDHSDPDVMTSAIIPDDPIHPGVAQFFREQDVWDESWEEGEL